MTVDRIVEMWFLALAVPLHGGSGEASNFTC